MPLRLHENPHRRLNALTGEWVLVSPHRTRRPWQGARETPDERRPAHDPNCYLCPGNPRAGDAVNPAYTGTHVFPNDFAALLPEGPTTKQGEAGLFQAQSVQGVCRVLCFSPRHDLTLARMTVPQIVEVVDLWAGQTAELGRKYKWVQIFENKGAAMGCSNPHPHGQVWAGDWIPTMVEREDHAQRNYLIEHRRILLVDYATQEIETGERVVLANEHWVWIVPWWALWPFETLLIPRRHVTQFHDLTSAERTSLAEILKRGLTRYDNLFECDFPYSMGWHGALFVGDDVNHWQLHAHFYPPLLRSASVKKFMVGYELLAEPQRDLTPEQAAARLRGLSDTHFAKV
jgi:UDPglucose--hexose-1-phosphate uridylyltransferase